MNDPIPTNPYDPAEAGKMAEAKLEALRRLCTRIEMVRPTALSISIDFPFPYTASREICSILDNLPTSCISLEIDMKHGSSIPTLTADFVAQQSYLHLCNSIRTTLPRLRLPLICPAIFSVNAPGQDGHSKVLLVPMLKTCLINLSLRAPGYPFQGAWATTCSNDITRTPYVGLQDELPSALPPVVSILRDFARLNSPNLERFWVIDVQPRDPTLPHYWAAWVRRDFISNASFPIPVANIGGFRRDAWLARVPSPTSQGKTQDWLSSLERLEMVAEGNTWIDTTSGARLPMAMLRGHGDKCAAPLSRAQFQERNKLTCMLWVNEDNTGEKLLLEGPGELMQHWDLNESTPSGWTRDEHTGSPMVRT
ncbi:hypothetical protein HD806DRAFT_488380 [Xylariaceae sp. AK1471]|nr:hypothetical protein HD806DRAFT_488380 [Xylariaceae sp. AK1471]